MQTAKRLGGVEEYYFSQKLREIEQMNARGKQVINLGIGSPDLPPHRDVIRVLQEETAKPTTHAYQSYMGSPILRQAIAVWYKRSYNVELDPASEILPLIGSKEGIMHICMTYINEGDLVLIPDPGYPTYRSAASIAGGHCVAYELKKENKWFPDFAALEQTIGEYRQANSRKQKTALMFVNYPHMPTGQLPDKPMFEKLIAFANANGVLLVHDNPYSFILNDSPMSLFSVDGARDCVIELNSLSKSHNMAGWRIGMLCASKQRITEVLRFKSNMDSGMFLPLQLAAAKGLGLEKAWYDEVNLVYAQRREKVFALLNLLQCTFDTGQAGMFVWAAIPENYKDGYALSDEILYASNVFITPGGIFGSAGNRYVRVSLCCTIEKITAAINRIKQQRA